MKRSTTAIVGLVLIGSTSAFRDTSPILIWSSSPNAALREAASEITTGVISADAIYSSLSSLGCDWNTIVSVQVEDLHQSHLSSLPLPASPDLHVPYLVRPSRSSLDASLEEWALVCGASTSASSTDQKRLLQYSSSRLDLEKTIASLPTYDLFILSGTRTLSDLPDFTKQDATRLREELKRQEQPFPSDSPSSPEDPDDEPSSTPTRNSTIPTGGPLLDRVQIITTPIILGLLISLGVLLPILVVGISALAGIQVPPRMLEIGKSLSVSQERKEQ
ncbi:hypothetical protein M231_06205 [Tremella mesenterica]|uniref:Protein BIG1 n=1 Tax=Tremella mesenterica TaxID=5217 RepID=A0A4Q1BE96_TREME|nr:hypothetical protein M231_06205 [Tremella mesenterica]